jgi:hypothetical protein
MDINDEMMMELLMQDEADTTADHEQQMIVLTALLRYREQLLTIPRRGGSRVGKVKNKNWHRLAGALFLDSDYFADDATNTPKEFRHRFQMNKETFMSTMSGVREFDDYFMCKPDCTRLYGFSSVQKCTAALRCIAYGAPCDTNEDYLRMAESTCFETMTEFVRWWWKCLERTTCEH